MNCEMAFLIVFPSFTPKKDAFFIGFKSFLILFSYSVYTFYSFLIQYNCSFSGLLPDFSYMMAAAFPGLSPDLRLFLSLCCLLINFLLFTAFLCIIHLISLCFSLIIFIPSYLYLYRSTPVNRSFHSSGRFFLL